ncbi:MAG: transposase [Candidatus Peribacteraceae bacterium]|nr:transposase [Candidatus Peribacteraceae bacterium]
MAEKFIGKYRIESTRLKGWNYSEDGAYFVTICTDDRTDFFGEIKNGKLIETEQCRICRACWLDLPNHYPNCVLDAFVIMPNHVHGIIVIDNWRGGRDVIVETGLKPVSTGKPVHPKPPPPVRKKYPLSEIVRGFKTFTARKINQRQNTPGQPFWQRNYYDRIIRDENELNHTREYIWNNPKNWANDRKGRF